MISRVFFSLLAWSISAFSSPCFAMSELDQILESLNHGEEQGQFDSSRLLEYARTSDSNLKKARRQLLEMIQKEPRGNVHWVGLAVQLGTSKEVEKWVMTWLEDLEQLASPRFKQGMLNSFARRLEFISRAQLQSATLARSLIQYVRIQYVSKPRENERSLGIVLLTLEFLAKDFKSILGDGDKRKIQKVTQSLAERYRVVLENNLLIPREKTLLQIRYEPLINRVAQVDSALGLDLPEGPVRMNCGEMMEKGAGG